MTFIHLIEKKLAPHPPFPKRLFHGSKWKFDSFDLNFFGNTDNGYYGIGVYLSPSIESANDYGWHLYECEVINPKPFYLWSSATMGDDIQARVDLSILPEYAHIAPSRKVPTGYHIRKRFDPGNGYTKAGKVYAVMPKQELYDHPDVRYGSDHDHPYQAVVSFNDDLKDLKIGGGWTSGLLKQLGRGNFSDILKKNGYNCLVTYDTSGVGEVMVIDAKDIRILRHWEQRNKYDFYEHASPV